MKTKKAQLKAIRSNNDFHYDALKAIEELNELATAITQKLTKGGNDAEIISEFGDVDFRLSVLKGYFDKKQIAARSKAKRLKSVDYLKTKKYEKV